MNRPTLSSLILVTLLVSCGDKPETPPSPSASENPPSAAETTAPVSAAAPAPAAPKIWSDVLIHRALREGNPEYTGNAQFQITPQGQPEAMVLANCGITNIDMLAGMPLLMLDLQGCPVMKIEALRGMPLVELFLDNTNVEDLSPLAGNTTLKKLFLNASNVKDLAPLKGAPLEELNLVGCRVSDIGPLAGMPLKMLWLTGLPVTDLSPLATTPVVSVTLHRTQVENLQPLATIRTLQRIHIGETPVKDLTPISGLPLTRLVFTPSTVEKGIDAIRRIPTMQQLGVEFEDAMETLMSPSEFWAKYDAGSFNPSATPANPAADSPAKGGK